MRHPSLSRLLALSFLLLLGHALWAQQRALSPEDIMKFREIHHTALTPDGRWLAFTAQPDRGDGEVRVKATDGSASFAIPRGSRPQIASTGRWVAAALLPEATLTEAKQSKQGMALLSTVDGSQSTLKSIERYTFSPDGRWLAVQKSPKAKGKSQKAKGKSPKDGAGAGRDVLLFMPGTGDTLTLPAVTAFAFDSTSTWLAYAVADSGGLGNGLYVVGLKDADVRSNPVIQKPGHAVSALSWYHDTGRLLFALATPDTGGLKAESTLWLWEAAKNRVRTVLANSEVSPGWTLPDKASATWSRDGRRLFVGLVRPQKEEAEVEQDTSGVVDPFDRDAILEGRGVDVWHWNDEYISPQQKKLWPRMKDKRYTAVFHLNNQKLVPLADETLPTVAPSHHEKFLLATSDKPYRQLLTWDGGYSDVYLVGLSDGERIPVVEKLGDRAHYAPAGRYVAYYLDGHWHLFDVRKRTTRNLTRDLDVPFADEDHDYPEAVPGYGLAGWTEQDRAVLIYDKYDLWSFDTKTGLATCLTKGEGRKTGRTYRLIATDARHLAVDAEKPMLLSSYDNARKNDGFYRLAPGDAPVPLLETGHKYRFVQKAEAADRVLFTRERYTEFPDLWMAGLDFADARRLTEVNPQIAEFAWGEAELVHWSSADGIPLDGVLIKPGNYEKGKRYPVLVYYYRFFSQRLHEFNQMVINHRPNFPFFASNGYCVFLPDIRFDIGLPGPAATQCLVPGVQKLIDMGVADPQGICLHGHSWSGYQTAFVVTQTNLFSCAIAGAPVSNMTSAYGGIRYGTGMARQFQYEKSQSRIGKTLWEGRDLYIENSPLFFADRIQTPLLLMSGDEDGAVPWTQSIELYLAMRRLQKPCVFLSYRGEDHHPKSYANKLDYTLRFKTFVDHFCKGAPAPDWWTKGAPYQGK